MNIYVIKDNQQYGPYSAAEVIGRMKANEFAGSDLCWCDGRAGVIPLWQIVLDLSSGTLPPTAAYSPAQLIRIANKQKALIWILLFFVPLNVIPRPVDLAATMAGMGFTLHILSIIVCCQLARALGKNVWLWTLLALVPVVNLMPFSNIVSQSNRALINNGIPAGFMGVDLKALDRLVRVAAHPTGDAPPPVQP